MEDVLDLYHEEYDRERPVVCFDETSKQLLGDVRPPVKAKPGRYDTEYQRNGTRASRKRVRLMGLRAL